MSARAAADGRGRAFSSCLARAPSPHADAAAFVALVLSRLSPAPGRAQVARCAVAAAAAGGEA
eukprot:12622038-Alexandrium_andersonii.AAC.1